MRTLLTGAEVALALRMPREKFLRSWRAMRRERGFPDRFPGTLCWDPRALELWQDRALVAQGLLREAPAAAPPVLTVTLDPATEAARLDDILVARARAIAGRPEAAE